MTTATGARVIYSLSDDIGGSMVYGCSTHWGVGRPGGWFFLGEEEAGGRNTGVVIRKQSAWVSLLRTTTKCRMAA